MENINFEKFDGADVCFINTLALPDRTIPQNHYRYNTREEGKYSFFRLVTEVHVLQKGGVGMEYRIDRWHEISVKRHCQDSLKAMIDLQNGASEFISGV